MFFGEQDARSWSHPKNSNASVQGLQMELPKHPNYTTLKGRSIHWLCIDEGNAGWIPFFLGQKTKALSPWVHSQRQRLLLSSKHLNPLRFILQPPQIANPRRLTSLIRIVIKSNVNLKEEDLHVPIGDLKLMLRIIRHPRLHNVGVHA